MNETSLGQNERTNAAPAHGSILLGMFSRGVFGILLAFLIWVTQRSASRFAAREAAQAVVYQIAGLPVTIAVWLGWGILLAGSILLPALIDPGRPETVQPYTMMPAVLLIIVPFAVMIGWIVLGVYAAVQAWHGKDYSYPLIGRWVR